MFKNAQIIRKLCTIHGYLSLSPHSNVICRNRWRIWRQLFGKIWKTNNRYCAVYSRHYHPGVDFRLLLPEFHSAPPHTDRYAQIRNTCTTNNIFPPHRSCLQQVVKRSWSQPQCLSIIIICELVERVWGCEYKFQERLLRPKYFYPRVLRKNITLVL